MARTRHAARPGPGLADESILVSAAKRWRRAGGPASRKRHVAARTCRLAQRRRPGSRCQAARAPARPSHSPRSATRSAASARSTPAVTPSASGRGGEVRSRQAIAARWRQRSALERPSPRGVRPRRQPGERRVRAVRAAADRREARPAARPGQRAAHPPRRQRRRDRPAPGRPRGGGGPGRARRRDPRPSRPRSPASTPARRSGRRARVAVALLDDITARLEKFRDGGAARERSALAARKEALSWAARRPGPAGRGRPRSPACWARPPVVGAVRLRDRSGRGPRLGRRGRRRRRAAVAAIGLKTHDLGRAGWCWAVRRPRPTVAQAARPARAVDAWKSRRPAPALAGCCKVAVVDDLAPPARWSPPARRHRRDPRRRRRAHHTAGGSSSQPSLLEIQAAVGKATAPSGGRRRERTARFSISRLERAARRQQRVNLARQLQSDAPGGVAGSWGTRLRGARLRRAERAVARPSTPRPRAARTWLAADLEPADTAEAPRRRANQRARATPERPAPPAPADRQPAGAASRSAARAPRPGRLAARAEAGARPARAASAGRLLREVGREAVGAGRDGGPAGGLPPAAEGRCGRGDPAGRERPARSPYLREPEHDELVGRCTATSWPAPSRRCASRSWPSGPRARP